MAKIVKKKKRRRGGGSASSGSSGDTSPYRPRYVHKMPPCGSDCPNNNKIRHMLTTIGQSEMYERTMEDSIKIAWEEFVTKTPFPSVCGRVCPHPCESECNRKEVDERVSINAMERFIGDYSIKQNWKLQKLTDEERDEKIAVIGSGPGGLSCAYQLARLGYKVTVFEAFDKTGGMLRYGIPRFRLPADILDAEIARIAELGVEIKCNTKVGKDISLEDLKKDYQAVYVGIGAHTGRKLGIDGDDSENVIDGIEFLNRINSDQEVDVGNNVVVIGGGNTAIDAVRVSKRLGAKEVTLLYRRTVNEMPADAHEIKAAEEEGVKFHFLATPISMYTDGNRATSMKCIKMELGEPDSSGRRRPVPIEGSEFDLDASIIIPAISQAPDFTGFETLREGRDWIKVDEDFKTLLDKDSNIYSGGDVVNLDTVIQAIAHGRKAAVSIDDSIKQNEKSKRTKLPKITYDKMYLPHYEKKARVQIEELAVEKRFDNLVTEVSATFNADQAMKETIRCLSCGECFKCGNCFNYCQDNAVLKPMDIKEDYRFKLEYCQGCKKCAENCPCGFIDMVL